MTIQGVTCSASTDMARTLKRTETGAARTKNGRDRGPLSRTMNNERNFSKHSTHLINAVRARSVFFLFVILSNIIMCAA